MKYLNQSERNLISMLVRLWRSFGASRRLQFKLALSLMIVSGVTEVVSLGALLPVLAALVSPEKITHSRYIVELANSIGVSKGPDLVLLVVVIFAITALVSGGVRLTVLWVSTKLSFLAAIDLGGEMYRRTLYQSYKVHISRNSADVISGITTKTSSVALGVLMPILNLISSFVLLFAIFATLLVIDPIVAILSLIGFGVCYGVIVLATRSLIERNSVEIAIQQTRLFRAIEEGLGGVRDVILDGTQELYCDVYSRSDRTLRMAQSSNTFISGSPRHVMEVLGVLVIAMLAYGVSKRDGGLAEALPVLGVLALGAQRLVPALQQIYAAWATIAGNRASLVDALRFLEQPLPDMANLLNGQVLEFKELIQLKGISFEYERRGPRVLDGISINISQGSRVAFVGGTGGGKSTLADILMGLLQPTEGQVLVDGVSIVGRQVVSWQKNVAHVPQSVYLAEGSIAENIAFGVPVEQIDYARVRYAANLAQLENFIENELINRYETQVGERGIKLSGGQRQRIGVARALYKQAKVLIFDEATSALDNTTEKGFMEAIERLGRDYTIIFIAHRLSTVRHCDKLFELSSGRLVAEGTFSELVERSPTFKAMALGIQI